MSSLKLKIVKTKLHLEHYKDLYIFGGACFAAGAITVVAFRKPPKEISDAAAKKLLDICRYIERNPIDSGFLDLDMGYVAGAQDAAIHIRETIEVLRK